jgi:hypothetical protein
VADTVYRFLPWARRGLSAALPDEPTPTPNVPSRAAVAVKVDVAGAGTAETSVLLHGPGDVIGLDPSQVVRTSPRPYATDTEPNYLVAVDLDAPELPWLFTPRGIPVGGHLPPWLVLIVVEDRPGVTVSLPTGAPLPHLRIDGGAAAELPDLAESWAWAHVQLVEPEGGAGDVAGTLATSPDHNVARLLCPRRLAPNRRWIAALVPAYDVGVTRGLGGKPADGSTLKPAWAKPDAVTLPLYFHWEFQTGPEGDFESLAQRIKPHAAAATVGFVPMHVGEGAPPIRVPAGQNRILDMDGALRTPAAADGTLADVPPALADGLTGVTRTLADAADGVIDEQILIDASRQPVGPPVYASAHVRRWQVRNDDAEWFRELNIDPRPRVAAGLAAECVRANQEDIANAAWQQVGDVMAAEAALQRAALGKMISVAFHRRHLMPMPDDRLLALAGPAAARTPVAGRSLTATVAVSSLPDAVLDAGLRRALAPAGRAVQRAAHRVGVDTAGLRPNLVGTLAAGREDLDATRFDRPVLTGVPPATLAGAGDLTAIGLPVDVAPDIIGRLIATATALAGAPSVADRERLTVRADLRQTGLLGQAHVEAGRALADRAADTVAGAVAGGAVVDVTTVSTVSTGALLDSLLSASTGATGGIGLLFEGPVFTGGGAVLSDPARPVAVDVLDLDAGGTLVLRSEAGRSNSPVARLDHTIAGGSLGAVLSRLPVDGIARRAPGADLPLITSPGLVHGEVPVLRTGRFDGPIGARPVVTPDLVIDLDRLPLQPERTTVAVSPLLRDGAVISRFETALTLQGDNSVLTLPAPVSRLVPYDLAGATTAVRRHLDPSVSQPLRRDALVSLAGRRIADLMPAASGADGWWATRAQDRVMAYPTFPTPAYGYLAAYDRTRFCPGIDDVPPDSVTLLETNPRFIAAFLAGLNHETNRELLWRGFPTDSRGTPFRRFWARLDGNDDIPPMHGWRTGTLSQQTTDPKGSLVLLLRGDLLRRYPNTIVVALRANGPREPSRAAADLRRPVFAGRFDPDVSFFGFPLVDTDLQTGAGWFFALMEPVTEPRFGLDETKGGPAGGGAAAAADRLAWPDTGIEPAGHLGLGAFPRVGLQPVAAQAEDVAATFFQRPFALYVHAKHLLTPLPLQR